MTATMTRYKIVTAHLVLSAFFLPFLLLMPLSGVVHLLGIPEPQLTEPAFTIEQTVPTDAKDRESFFRAIFKEKGINFDFETIRASGNDLTFRPSSREHYTAKLTATGAEVYLQKPGLLKKMLELHKGHGPMLFKRVQTAFGFGLLLVAASGVFLAATVPPYRKKMLIAFAAGAAVFFATLLF